MSQNLNRATSKADSALEALKQLSRDAVTVQEQARNADETATRSARARDTTRDPAKKQQAATQAYKDWQKLQRITNSLTEKNEQLKTARQRFKDAADEVTRQDPTVGQRYQTLAKQL